MIRGLNRTKQIVQGLPGKINLKDISTSEINYFVVNYETANKMSLKPVGTLLVFVHNEEAGNALEDKFPDSSTLNLPTSSNNGCYYPPHLTKEGYQTPFFKIFVSK